MSRTSCPAGHIFDNDINDCREMTKEEKELSQMTRFAIYDFNNYKRSGNKDTLIVSATFHGQAMELRRKLGHKSAIAWNNQHPTAGYLLHTMMYAWKQEDANEALMELKGD